MRLEQAPADPFDLRARRVHEAEGRGSRAFALFQAVRHPGPLAWILPAHVPELPMLRGLPRDVGERLHVFRASGETDLLWCIFWAPFMSEKSRAQTGLRDFSFFGPLT